MVKKSEDTKAKTKTVELESISVELEDEKLEDAPKLDTKKSKKSKKPKESRKKPLIIVLIIIILLGGVVAWFLLTGAFDLKTGQFDFNRLLGKQTDNCETNGTNCETEAASAPEETPKEKIYSRLTGLEISDAKINSLPVYCIQIPNDTYGARPQVGLSHAAIVFEAIAEGGITRLATIYQNLDDSVIGPIRSLRMYHLDWESAFDCTLVHAGGEKEAAQTAANGSYRDLTESQVYMYRDSRGYNAPNNLFTSTALLTKFNSDKGYTSSNPKVFPRLTPVEAENEAKLLQDSYDPNDPSTPKLYSKVKINFGNAARSSFNTIYTYDEKTNSYARSFANGSDHIVYNCKAGLDKPSPKQECGEAVQVAPNVVIAMMVDEYTKGNSRENIQTIGTGDAYIFQNGDAIKGRWTKNSKAEQIVFTDKNGDEIKLTPGQVWIAAVPNAYGSVEY